MRSLRYLCLSLCLAVPMLAANKDMDRALEGINASKTPADALQPSLYILTHASEAPSMHLFMASMVAIANKRTEDAAFLFYAGQLRSRHDMVRYPPKAKGGDSPAVLLGALNQQIGAAVNPAIMREPKSMASAVRRIEQFRLVTAKDYDPGWPYSTPDPAGGSRQFAENHAAFVRQMGGMATLLNDAAYFAAFKIVQDLNFAPDPKRAKEKAAAEATMLAIEKKRDIEGIFYRRGK